MPTPLVPLPNSPRLNDVKATYDDLIVAAHRARAGETINRSGGQIARDVAEPNIPLVADPDAARRRRSPCNPRRLAADNGSNGPRRCQQRRCAGPDDRTDHCHRANVRALATDWNDMPRGIILAASKSLAAPKTFPACVAPRPGDIHAGRASPYKAHDTATRRSTSKQCRSFQTAWSPPRAVSASQAQSLTRLQRVSFALTTSAPDRHWL